MKKNELSIIIVNYNVRSELLECLYSIYQSKPKINFEIIVVDNSEKDLISKDLKNKFPKVKFIKSDKNLGYGKGNNLGVKQANGEFVFILNPDTKLVSGKIESLIKFYKKNKKVGVVAPLLVKEDGNAFDLQGTRELTPKRAIFSLSFLKNTSPGKKVYNDYYDTTWNKKTIKEVDNVPGTAFLIKRELFEKIGGFDENFFLFFEEFDLCKRLKDKGYKNYILPDISFYHKWGASTAKNENTNKFFLESRFYYFKKNYGIIKALVTEFFLRINKYSVVLSFFLILGFFLRTFKISTLMAFIADQGLFYLPAKDLVAYKIIPLVGPETSHPWIHHGPLWIYTLAFFLWIFKFNPVPPAYFIAILGTITILIFYLVVKAMFNRNIALLGAIIFASSPLIVVNARFPYHTSPIPFFVIILFFLTYKWVKGKIWVFPLITLLLGVLYNHEITTFVYFIAVGVILLYGIIKKRLYARKLWNLKIILSSIITFSIPMLPFYIYDTSHGYRQTLGFLVWVVYRIVKFPLSLIDPRFKSPGSSPSTIPQFFEYYERLIFYPNKIIVILFLVLTAVFIVFYFSRLLKFDRKHLIRLKSKIPTSYALLFLFFFTSILGLSVHRVPIEADTLLFAPFLIILTAMAVLWMFRDHLKAALALVILVAVINSYVLLSTDFLTNVNGIRSLTLKDREVASDKVIQISSGKPYNLIGVGVLNDYKSFTMPYEYLLWWKGSPPTKNSVPLKIVVQETSTGISVYKKK